MTGRPTRARLASISAASSAHPSPMCNRVLVSRGHTSLTTGAWAPRPSTTGHGATPPGSRGQLGGSRQPPLPPTRTSGELQLVLPSVSPPFLLCQRYRRQHGPAATLALLCSLGRAPAQLSAASRSPHQHLCSSAERVQFCRARCAVWVMRPTPPESFYSSRCTSRRTASD